MSKRNLQIVSLIISIISLIYLVSAHYGYIRYAKLQLMQPSYFIENYKKLPKNSNRVVASFKFDEKDLPKLKPFINSLLDQSMRVDDIAVVIPYSDIPKIPENIKSLLTVIGYKKNYSACENIICSVMKEPENNTRIFLLKPKVYDVDFVQSLIEESDKDPTAIIKSGDSYLVKPAFFSDKISTCSSSGEEELIGQCASAKIKEI